MLKIKAFYLFIYYLLHAKVITVNTFKCLVQYKKRQLAIDTQLIIYTPGIALQLLQAFLLHGTDVCGSVFNSQT